MSQPWNGELDDDLDKDEEYIVVKQGKKIQAYLKAEEEENAKEHVESVLKIIEEKHSSSPLPISSKNNKLKFIQDDRDRQYVQQQSSDNVENQLAKKNSKNDRQPKFKQQQSQNEGKEKKTKYVDKELVQKVNDNPRKLAYVEKKISNSQEDKDVPKSKIYIEKSEKKCYKQIQRKNNQEIHIQLIQGDNCFENELYIGKKDPGSYFEEARQMITKHNVIVLKSFAAYIEKCFLVAGLMAKEFPTLKQISIPNTVKVKIRTGQSQRMQTRASIKIKQSLKNGELDSNNIGYQEFNKPRQPQQLDKKDKQKPAYKEKQEPDQIYDQKKPKYAQKQQKGQGNDKDSRKYEDRDNRRKQYGEKDNRRSNNQDRDPRRRRQQRKYEPLSNIEDERSLR